MHIKHIAPAVALPFALLMAAPAMAEPDCSGGSYAADALVTPSEDVGDIQSATQYAWDGGGRVVEVCNLLTEGADFFATWSLFSGEIDSVYPGICVSLTNTQGVEWFSCSQGEIVAAAFAAAPGSEEGIIRFDVWEPEAPTLQ